MSTEYALTGYRFLAQAYGSSSYSTQTYNGDISQTPTTNNGSTSSNTATSAPTATSPTGRPSSQERPTPENPTAGPILQPTTTEQATDMPSTTEFLGAKQDSSMALMTGIILIVVALIGTIIVIVARRRKAKKGLNN